MSLFSELNRKSEASGPVRIGVVGTGFFGAGLVRRMAVINGMGPVVAANRTLARAMERWSLQGSNRVRSTYATTPRPLRLPSLTAGM